MQRFPRRWDKITCVDYLQRKLILNALTYYEFNTSIISNDDYNELKSQLIKLQKCVDIKSTQYGYVMKDLDHISGIDVCNRLALDDKNRLMCIANITVKRHENSKQSMIKRKKGRLL